MVFNATFNNISVVSCGNNTEQKATDLIKYKLKIQNIVNYI